MRRFWPRPARSRWSSTLRRAIWCSAARCRRSTTSTRTGLAPTFAALAKATGGKLKWKLLTGGQLFGLRASLTGVGGGMADGAIIIPSFVQSKIPHVYTITDMALFAEDPLVAAAASAETIFHDCPECLADFKKQKTVPLGFYGLNTYKLLCNTKVTNLAEVKGKRMRTSGANGRWARAMGGDARCRCRAPT